MQRIPTGEADKPKVGIKIKKCGQMLLKKKTEEPTQEVPVSAEETKDAKDEKEPINDKAPKKETTSGVMHQSKDIKKDKKKKKDKKEKKELLF